MAGNAYIAGKMKSVKHAWAHEFGSEPPPPRQTIQCWARNLVNDPNYQPSNTMGGRPTNLSCLCSKDDTYDFNSVVLCCNHLTPVEVKETVVAGAEGHSQNAAAASCKLPAAASTQGLHRAQPTPIRWCVGHAPAVAWEEHHSTVIHT